MIEVNKIGIIGVGLIGGSLALALRKSKTGSKFYGYDTDPISLKRAVEMGVLDRSCNSLLEIAEDCDLIIIATPVRAITTVLKEIGRHLKEGSLVMDVGSTKAGIVRFAEMVLPERVTFVGGHPMAGSEQQVTSMLPEMKKYFKGIENADPDLFLNATFIFTPTTSCDAEVFSFLLQTFNSIGARVIFMDPEAHDRAVSLISHLPHLVAFSLVNLLVNEAKTQENISKLVSSGFRDMTRIASSNPYLWVEILMENRNELLDMIDRFLNYMEEGRKLLQEGEERALLEFAQQARTGRLQITPALKDVLKELYTLTIPVANRPGMISSITMALGEKGINIEDLEISHPLEGEKGLLRILLRGEEAAQLARQTLSQRGYQASLEKTLENA